MIGLLNPLLPRSTQTNSPRGHVLNVSRCRTPAVQARGWCGADFMHSDKVYLRIGRAKTLHSSTAARRRRVGAVSTHDGIDAGERRRQARRIHRHRVDIAHFRL